MAIQIGKYKRPGIFIEEFDNSIISSPTVEGITNLVIGISKKGPINTPVRVTTIGDFEAIFGQLDRNLERKGSFFHRTTQKMLETSPVYAMNLLLTDDNLDIIDYRSISASAQFNNDILRQGPYRRFFDTTGFWRRDTESFIGLTKPNEGYSQRALNFTNLSDRAISVFVFKSSLTGFNRTLLEWYGSIDKMPSYVNHQDYAADYMVDVVVVGGDWSNYQELAVDTRWSAYFNASGLRKDQVRNFANDRNVNLLAFYEGLSLIPYFRDLSGRNLFIETNINRDTDRTGLYCAFNNDLVEENYYNGILDVLGNTIVGKGEVDIDFLSYKETIAEQIEIIQTPLDLPGNVTAILGGSYSGYNGYNDQQPHLFSKTGLEPIGPDASGSPATDAGIVYGGSSSSSRTAWFAEGSIYNVEEVTNLSGTSSITINYNIAEGAFAVIADNFIQLSTTASRTETLTVYASDYPVSSGTNSYVATFLLDSTGEFKVSTSAIPFTGDNWPSVLPTDVILSYLTFNLTPNGLINSPVPTNVSLNNMGYKDMTFGTQSGSDYYISEVNSGQGDAIKIEFWDTATTPKVNDYVRYRRFKMFNRLVSMIDSPNKKRMALNLGPNSNYRKVSFENITISDIITSSTQNKSFILNTGLNNTELNDILEGFFVIYSTDNEFILGTDGVKTKEDAPNTTEGVAGKYSKLYQRYYDGIINTMDYFHSNRLYQDYSGDTNALLGKPVDINFIDGETVSGATGPFAGFNFVIFENEDTTGLDMTIALDFQTYEQVVFPGSTLNSGAFTILAQTQVGDYTPNELAIELDFPNGAAYQVVEEVEEEILTDQTLVFDYLKKHYLKMYLENDGDLIVEFMDELLQSTEEVNTEANNVFYIVSEKSNLKQSLEIEIPSSYVQSPNKVLVKGDRYTEVRVGDFLEAYVDESTLEPGQVARKFTRVLSKRAWPNDTTLSEITCDARIKKIPFGNDYQTMRYVSIENYVTTYKAITLKGFKIRQASLPDGTDVRQTSIMNIISKGTPLFKALTNKEAIDFRYLIDAFGLGLTERSKQPLVDICGERLDAFGFINMPSLRQFKNSQSPTFVNSENVLQIEYVASGGDPESNPAFLYSFADGPGSTCVGYFTPYVVINDNGRPLEHPPAPFVATTFMAKHIGNITNVTPWTIAAGVTNGRVTGISGLEMTFTLTDIEYLNQAQMNPLVFKRNRGYVIETENTAQTLYKSALSYIHVREVLIELERELSAMLLDYQWKFNTADVRAEIKLRADSICETYVSRNGLYNYFNKMDEENNTADIIDNQIGVLDTYVEPIKGMGIIVNNITILRTGAISAGGFINP
jgi:hypothetical protein